MSEAGDVDDADDVAAPDEPGDEVDRAPVPDDGDDGDEVVEAPRPRRTALVTAAAVAVVMVALVAGFVVVLSDSGSSTDRAAHTELEGRAAPEVAGTTLDGAPFAIDDHVGSWVVVNFFATWCQPCLVEHPQLVALDEAYGDGGDVTLVSVVFDDDPENVAGLFEARGGDWPVVRDDDGQIAFDFGVAQVPETFLIDPDGIVRRKLIGGVTRSGIEAAIVDIEAELAGEPAGAGSDGAAS